MNRPTRRCGFISGALSEAFALMVSPALVCGLVGAVLFGNCGTLTPSAAAVRTADQFYDALSRDELQTAAQMFGREMLERKSPNELINELRQRQEKLDSPVARTQDSVFMTDLHGSSVRHGTLTKFQFACEYRNARTHEELRVFEPRDGGDPEIDDYRMEVLSNGTPTFTTGKK